MFAVVLSYQDAFVLCSCMTVWVVTMHTNMSAGGHRLAVDTQTLFMLTFLCWRGKYVPCITEKTTHYVTNQPSIAAVCYGWGLNRCLGCLHGLVQLELGCDPAGSKQHMGHALLSRAVADT
jgi:hypothetical protein